MYSLAKQINHRPIPKLIAVGLAAAATLAVLLFLAWPVAAQGQLSLSDFDREGLEVEALALFIAGDAGDEPALYNVSPRWDASGELLEGELGIGPDDEPVQRVMALSDGATLRFNDAGPLSLKDYFGANGDGSDLTVWLQTAGGSVSFPASGFGSAGGNYVNFDVPSDAAAYLSGIGAGDRFILALTRPEPTPTPTLTPEPTSTPTPTPTPTLTPEPTSTPTPTPTPTLTPEPTSTPTPTPTPTLTPEPTSTPTPTPTPTPVVEPPAQPAGLAIGSYTHESVELRWDDPGDDSITGYQILRRVRGDGPGFAPIADDTGSAATTYEDASVTPEARYTYRVKARNSAGLSPQSSYANVDVPAAPEPAQQVQQLGLYASVLQVVNADGTIVEQSIELFWEDPEDDAITGYRILRKIVADGTGFAVIEEDTGTTRRSFNDATAEPETLYAYRVLAIMPDDVSALFNDIELETYAEPTPTPTPTPTPEPLVPMPQMRATDSGPFSHDSSKDFDSLHTDNNDPIGIWGNSRTLYITDGVSPTAVFAYNRSDKAYNSSRSFNLHTDNSSPSGIWSDGRTMWVTDYVDKILYAYRLSNGARDSGKDLALDTDHIQPIGIWGNRDTIWVTVNDTNGPGQIWAYNRSTKLRDSDKDIATESNAEGIWSDGTTLWALLKANDKISAYDLATGVWEEDLDFTTLATAGNLDVFGLWSDGETMWVGDTFDAHIYAYRMPTGYQARLEDLAVYPYNIVGGTNDLGDFHWTTEEYVLNVTGEKAEVTLDWTPKDPNARVRASRSDTDRGRVGHQMALRYGSNEITFRVTAPGNIRKTYTLTVNRASDAAMGWNPVLEDGAPTDGYADTCATADTKWRVNGNRIEAYSRSTDERDSVRDFTATARAAGNRDVEGIACDVHTMWVQDGDDLKVYAYNMPAYANAPQRVTATSITTNRVSLRWNAPNLAYGEVTGYEVWRYDSAWSAWQTIGKLASRSAASEYGNSDYDPDLSIPASRVRQFEYGDHDGDGVDAWLHDHDGDDSNNNGCKDSVNNDVCALAQSDPYPIPAVGELSTPRVYVWPTPYEWLYDHDNNRNTPLRVVPAGTDLSSGRYYMHDHDDDRNTDMKLVAVYPHHLYTDTTRMAGGVEYVYLVYARYQYGRSEGADAYVIAASNTISRPSAPENLTKTVTSNSVTLRWEAPADRTATGYRIERYTLGEYTDDGSNKRVVLAERRSGRSYTDRTVDPAKGYVWIVYSVNRHGILSDEERSVSVYIGFFPDPE